MDPNATVVELAEALRARDFDLAELLAEDLHSWINNGGFRPSNLADYPKVRAYLRRH